jgi:hypothetical protein
MHHSDGVEVGSTFDTPYRFFDEVNWGDLACADGLSEGCTH